MMAGILFQFGTHAFDAVGRMLLFAMLLAYHRQKMAAAFTVVLVYRIGLLLTALGGHLDFSRVALSITRPVWIAPEWTLSSAKLASAADYGEASPANFCPAWRCCGWRAYHAGQTGHDPDYRHRFAGGGLLWRHQHCVGEHRRFAVRLAKMPMPIRLTLYRRHQQRRVYRPFCGAIVTLFTVLPKALILPFWRALTDWCHRQQP